MAVHGTVFIAAQTKILFLNKHSHLNWANSGQHLI